MNVWVETQLKDSSLSTLKYHWHVIVASSLFFTSVYKASKTLSPQLFPKQFKQFEGYTPTNWHVHVVSFIHSLVMSIGCLCILLDGELAKERVFGYVPWASNIYAFSCGYFVWDVVLSWKYMKYQGISMFMHGISAFFVLFLSFAPFINYYGAIFMFYELSTVFLNIHWFMDKLGYTGSKLQMVNGAMLLLSFFGVRIVFGVTMSIRLWFDVYNELSRVSLSYLIIYGVSNLVTTFLNFWWFRQMINMLLKRFSAPKESKKQ